jgi:Icc-related predicted phosphoesterase
MICHNKNKILVVGDIHGNFSNLNSLINVTQPEILLQVGDFGYWPLFTKHLQKPWKKIKSNDTKIYFCDGNHEDHECLRNLSDNEISKNVYYMKRGSTLKLPDGRNVLFVGGAFSIDYKDRTSGKDWFPDLELFSNNDLKQLPDEEIDVVISHTAPIEFFTGFRPCGDVSRKNLSYVLRKYKPKEWYFGHFHQYRSGVDYGCKWVMLANVESSFRWWIWI